MFSWFLYNKYIWKNDIYLMWTLAANLYALLTCGPHMVYMGTPYIFDIYMIGCRWLGYWYVSNKPCISYWYLSNRSCAAYWYLYLIGHVQHTDIYLIGHVQHTDTYLIGHVHHTDTYLIARSCAAYWYLSNS